MRVIVLGSGVIGVASAYYLAQQGAEVTVLDRQAGPAEETSFGNAGQISPLPKTITRISFLSLMPRYKFDIVHTLL